MQGLYLWVMDALRGVIPDSVYTVKYMRRKIDGDLKERIGKYRPSIEEMQDIKAREMIIVLSNMLVGPIILHKEKNKYGLYADKDYGLNDVITHFDGIAVRDRQIEAGVTENPITKKQIDTSHGFELKNKGRWIQHDRARYNAKINEDWSVSPTRNVERGDEITVDYGELFICATCGFCFKIK